MRREQKLQIACLFPKAVIESGRSVRQLRAPLVERAVADVVPAEQPYVLIPAYCSFGMPIIFFSQSASCRTPAFHLQEIKWKK